MDIFGAIIQISADPKIFNWKIIRQRVRIVQNPHWEQKVTPEGTVQLPRGQQQHLVDVSMHSRASQVGAQRTQW